MDNIVDIAYLEGYIPYDNPLWCDKISPRDGNIFLKDESTLKGKECDVLERNNQLGDDSFELLEYLRNTIGVCSLKNDCRCDPLYETPPLFDNYEDEFLASFEDLSNNPSEF